MSTEYIILFSITDYISTELDRFDPIKMHRLSLECNDKLQKIIADP